VDHHAGAVDVLEAEAGDLREPQAAGVGGHQQGAMLGVLQRVEEVGHLLLAEDLGQLAGRPRPGDVGDDLVAVEGDLVEELQGQAGLLEEVAGDLTLLDEVEQVGADVLGPELVGRGAEVSGEVGDPAGVGADGRGGPVEQGHVLDHAAS
jgi:hypothetical protein